MKGIPGALAVILTLFALTPALGVIWYVSGSVSVSGDGTSWGAAFKTIQEGINRATDGDTVIVGEGTYFENIRFMGKNIVLQSVEPSSSDVVANTVIDGNAVSSVVSFVGSEDESCVLAGFTIRHGLAKSGGGIYGGSMVKLTRATIRCNTIRDNRAGCSGGGMYACSGLIENNMVTANVAETEGGGLYGCGGRIRGNTVSYNEAGYRGGGLAECEGAVQGNSIWNNTAGTAGDPRAPGFGGGLYRCYGPIEDNVLAGNSAGYGAALCECRGDVRSNMVTGSLVTYPYGDAGSLYRCEGTIYGNTISGNFCDGIEDCTGIVENNLITGNDGAGVGGCNNTVQNNIITGNWGGVGACDGIIQNNFIARNVWRGATGAGLVHCHGIIQNNIIAGNKTLRDTGAGYDAGGAGLWNCDGIVRDNLICGNSTAQNGGGLARCDGVIENNTIVNNSAAYLGGGLVWCNAIIRNCVIWGNKVGPWGSQLYSSSDPYYSCVQGYAPDARSRLIADDPRFVDPDGPDNDLGTYEDNDYRLLPYSPCIDAGYNQGWMLDTPDLDGAARICKGVSSLTVDMGAYELFHLSIIRVKKLDRGQVELTWTSRPDDRFAVWSCLGLPTVTWFSEGQVQSRGAATFWIDPTAMTGKKFYRIEEW